MQSLTSNSFLIDHCTMLLFYVDECGDHSLERAPGPDGRTLKRGVSPYFVLSAVGIRDSSRQPIARAFAEIKTRSFGTLHRHHPWEDTEIKGRYLQRSSRSTANGKVLDHPLGFRVLDTQEKTTGLVQDIGLLISKFRPIIFSVVVDKRELLRQRRTDSPLGIAYALLHERIALAIEKLFGGESAIIIADQQTQHETYFRSGGMNAARTLLSRNLRVRPNFNLVVDKPLWVDTDYSAWDREIIQLADIAAYTTTRCMIDGASPELPSFLWVEIKRSMATHWRTGSIERSGFAIYPPPKTFPRL